MTRREFGHTLTAALILAGFVGTVRVGVGGAQEPFRISGRVLWISGESMAVAPYGFLLSPSGTAGLNVDLSRLSQDEYQRLAIGDSVEVIGMVTNRRDRVIATSIQRLPS